MSDAVADAFRKAMRLGHRFAIADRMSFDDIPGWDSVGHMNLVTELESHFGISLEMDEIVGLDSVGAVRAVVARALGACQDRCAEAHPLPPSTQGVAPRLGSIEALGLE